jgi:hypothetical protein
MDGIPRALAKRVRNRCCKFYRESWMHSIPPNSWKIYVFRPAIVSSDCQESGPDNTVSE